MLNTRCIYFYGGKWLCWGTNLKEIKIIQNYCGVIYKIAITPNFILYTTAERDYVP